ncbi:hydrophobin [Scleroderma yunnanense]
MFARVFAVASLALLAVANPIARGGSCSNGSISCCQQTQEASTFFNQLLAGNVLANVGASVSGLVGLQCSPITAVGLGSGCQANQQSVCCDKNNFNGLINVGCTPINIAA